MRVYTMEWFPNYDVILATGCLFFARVISNRRSKKD